MAEHCIAQRTSLCISWLRRVCAFLLGIRLAKLNLAGLVADFQVISAPWGVMGRGIPKAEHKWGISAMLVRIADMGGAPDEECFEVLPTGEMETYTDRSF
jgi:hypothetical protein